MRTEITGNIFLYFLPILDNENVLDNEDILFLKRYDTCKI